MRRLAALLVAALPVAGCVALPAPPSTAYHGPLDARIVQDPTGLGVIVSDEAHVALFEVVPGVGAGLVYPAAYAEGHRMDTGFNRLVLPPLASHRWAYLPHATGYGPRFYLLVASREPLRVGPYLDSPFALRRDVGTARFAALNAYGTMDRLAERVIPPQAESDWAADVLVVWPEHPVTATNPLVRVQCPNGRILVVPWSVSVAACELSERRVTPPAVVSGPPSGDGDGAEGGDAVRAPERSRPEPAVGEGEERVRSEPVEIGERTRPVVPARLAPTAPAFEPSVRAPVQEPAIRVSVAEPRERPSVDPSPRGAEPVAAPRPADPPRSRPATREAPARRAQPASRQPAPRATPRRAPASQPAPRPTKQRQREDPS